MGVEFENIKDEGYVEAKNSFLNMLLDGKIEKGIITSVYGAAGTGKTTFCIQVAKEIIDKGKKVLYVDTEGGFSIERAKQIIGEGIDRLLIKVLFSFNELKDVIEKLKEIAKDKEVGGIIVDSMSQPYRVEEREVQELNKEFSRLFYILAKIAKENNVVVVTTNQVYTDFSTNKLEIVGRDIPKYASKTMIFLTKNNKRRAILKKHRFLNIREVEFEIVNEGMKVRV